MERLDGGVVIGRERHVERIGALARHDGERSAGADELRTLGAVVVEPVAGVTPDGLVEPFAAAMSATRNQRWSILPPSRIAPWWTASALFPSGSRRKAP